MIGLLFGKSVVWGGQSRDAYGFRGAPRRRTCGRRHCSASIVCGALLLIAPAVFWWSLPLTAGYLVAIPFAVLTAAPALRRAFFQKLGSVRHPGGLRAARRDQGHRAGENA